ETASHLPDERAITGVEVQALAGRLLPRKSPLREGITENGDVFRSRPIVVSPEIASTIDRDAEERQKRCRNHFCRYPFRISRAEDGHVRRTEGGDACKGFRALAPVLVVVDGDRERRKLRCLFGHHDDITRACVGER